MDPLIFLIVSVQQIYKLINIEKRENIWLLLRIFLRRKCCSLLFSHCSYSSCALVPTKVLIFLVTKVKEKKHKWWNQVLLSFKWSYWCVRAVVALQEIAEEMGKKDWDFTCNPCDGNSIWETPKSKEMPSYNNTVNCTCSFPDGQCHVVEMYASFHHLNSSIYHADFLQVFLMVPCFLTVYIMLFMWGGDGMGMVIALNQGHSLVKAWFKCKVKRWDVWEKD